MAESPDAPVARAGTSASTASPEYFRLVRNAADQPVALEVAVVQFAPRRREPTSPTVDLVGTVHIADYAYYAELNRRFQKYDTILYELIARPGTKIPTGSNHSPSSSLSVIQRGLKDLLDLEFQLDAIDYNRPNMVHADMSPQQFTQSMHERGESFVGIFMRMFTYAWTHQENAPSDGSEFDILAALFDKNRTLLLKRVMAEQFQDMEGSLQALEGPKGSTLISQRNKIVLETLKKELASGKKQVAIFYGAGHMPNMEQHLRKDFDFVPIHTDWLVAWNLKMPAAAGKPPVH